MERSLHSQAVGENKTPGALLVFLHVHLVIWRHGVPRRTKSQGQISWHCGDTSWVEQTRKSLHFIKDPAGEQQSFFQLSSHSHHHSAPSFCLSLHTHVHTFSSNARKYQYKERFFFLMPSYSAEIQSHSYIFLMLLHNIHVGWYLWSQLKVRSFVTSKLF